MKTRNIGAIILSVVLFLFVSAAGAQTLVAPANLSAIEISSSRISLSWTDTNAGKNNESGFTVERSLSATSGFVQVGSVLKNITTYIDSGLSSGTTYYYRVQAYGRKGAISPYSNIAWAITFPEDTTPPSVPTGLTATAASCSQINLSWSASTDTSGSGLKGYNVYRNGAYLRQVTTTSTSDTGLAASTTYSYTVSAVDNAGNQSAQSSPATATTPSCPDVTPPSVPTGLTATAMSCNEISLSWSASTDTGGSGLKGYNVYRNGAYLKQVTTTSTSDTGLAASTTYSYTVSAVDNAGNQSAQSSPATATTPSCPDVTPPSVPTGLSATAMSCNEVSLSWSASTDTGGSGLKGYNVYRNGAYLKQVTTTSTSDTGLAASTTYSYTVSAVDNAGNQSAQSSPATATTPSCPDVTPPSVPTGLSATAMSCNEISLSWSASTDTGGSGLKGYNVYRNGAYLKQVTTTSTSDTGLAASTTYSYTVSAVDNAGNQSAQSSPATATTPACPDTTPPTGSITINSGAAYANTVSVTLTLSASDNSGSVSHMCISNTTSCSSWEAYATTKSWTLTTGDGTKTVYAWFRDAAGNTSIQYSDSIILDTTAPPVPSGLTATAVSSSQINLSWNPVVDTTGGSGLAGYKVSRGVTQIATTTATSYQDANLTASTRYCYTVRSYDLAGNESGQCTQVCATTQAGAAAGGVTIWAARFGSTGSDFGRAVAVDGADNVIMTGRFSGTVDFGGGPLTSIGSTSLFLAKYTADGAHLWSKRFGGTSGSINVQNIAVDGSGNIVVIGSFTGTVDFGGGPITSAGASDIFIAKYSSSGTHVWSKGLGYSLDDIGYGVAIDNAGNVIVTGFFAGSVDFGGGILRTNGGLELQIFLAKYTPAGGHLWSKTFSCTSGNKGYGVAVDGSGNILLTGFYMGTIDFGGGALPTSSQSALFVSKFFPDGLHLWSKGFGNTSGSCTSTGYDIAADSSGNVVVTGIFMYTVDFGGGPLFGSVSGDIFVAKYSGANGSHLWSQRFGGVGTDLGNRVAVDGDNNVVITGYVQTAVDFGGGLLTGFGMQDIFVAKYSGANGSHLWSKQYGSASNDVGNGIAVDSSGNVLATGYFLNTVDFGGVPLTSAGGLDIFLIQLAP